MRAQHQFATITITLSTSETCRISQSCIMYNVHASIIQDIQYMSNMSLKPYEWLTRLTDCYAACNDEQIGTKTVLIINEFNFIFPLKDFVKASH